MHFRVVDMIDGLPTFEEPMNSILAHCQKGGAIKILSPLEYHTDRQRAWFKGVLLPALAKDQGDTVGHWQKKLIKEVFPEDIKREDGLMVYPSISQYGKKKMTTLIEESVAQCHDWGFMWVTLPESELRK